MSVCRICEKRRPQRFCIGIGGEICSRCCGEQREVTIDCPFECEYLREARRHERPVVAASDKVPHAEVRVTDEYVESHSALITRVIRGLLEAARQTPGVVDSDVREALESMIKTQLTRESGLIYETRPNNPYAAAIQQRLRDWIEEYRDALAEETGVHSVGEHDVLLALVFLRRIEFLENNGRRRGRAFLDFLRRRFPESAGRQQPASPIVRP